MLLWFVACIFIKVKHTFNYEVECNFYLIQINRSAEFSLKVCEARMKNWYCGCFFVLKKNTTESYKNAEIAKVKNITNFNLDSDPLTI